ncbi:hypothetical protein BV98_001325 [Sphingobium herbicidovorans NBRC 16415]|uniref:Uncharacterized protein n=1 Tax=Sphingobium herbicidovorans (strain ATCC 700291 / DSM 11019 / CCUG 56400 / KCTC 2939 / LMG 18315 / NBRC 16415 / MH) TaxID=1219045 RepID=A0A086PBM6_SPHHM|nr:hypothetical protein [Sphingobium herbicidovorans]KFG90794.1 hypothetical protein BV98_001325 [Sphingobium herbicidovorans NBRC 16415]
MKDLDSLRSRAFLLMQNALALLDEAHEEIAAARLQGAIDTLAPGGPRHRADASHTPSPSGDCPHNAALVRAIGGVLAGVTASLSRRSPMSVGEFAKFLATYAAVASEVSEEEGQIIACWSGMLSDVAEGCHSS